MQFTQPTKANDINRSWIRFDAKGKILGRLATEIAVHLLGKKKPYYVANLDCGDHVVVINARDVAVSGKKNEQKLYERYSGYPGGRHVKTLWQVRKETPTRIIFEAVSGMLPKNKLRDSRLSRLYVFADDNHPYKEKLKIQS